MEQGIEEVKQQKTSEEEHVVVIDPHPGVPISLIERCYFRSRQRWWHLDEPKASKIVMNICLPCIFYVSPVNEIKSAHIFAKLCSNADFWTFFAKILKMLNWIYFSWIYFKYHIYVRKFCIRYDYLLFSSYAYFESGDFYSLFAYKWAIFVSIVLFVSRFFSFVFIEFFALSSVYWCVQSHIFGWRTIEGLYNNPRKRREREIKNHGNAISHYWDEEKIGDGINCETYCFSALNYRYLRRFK